MISPCCRVNTDQLLTTNVSNRLQVLVPAKQKPDSLFAQLDFSTDKIMKYEFNACE